MDFKLLGLHIALEQVVLRQLQKLVFLRDTLREKGDVFSIVFFLRIIFGVRRCLVLVTALAWSKNFISSRSFILMLGSISYVVLVAEVRCSPR